MQDRLRKILGRWLIGPFADQVPLMQQKLTSLQHRLVTLEQMIRVQQQGPHEVSPLMESVDEGRLGDLPDAHLGAQ
tara:strand:+ start:215 stop:442 length:228 start_codon:yes stop_codon:yes gene_type:complete